MLTTQFADLDALTVPPRVGCCRWGSVGRVSVFWLRWCGWGVGRGLDQGLEGWGGVVCVSCESGLSV